MTLLLFSGGRDSTLAAVNLASQGVPLTLLTLTHDRLSGLDAVRVRLDELASHLPCRTEWLLVERNPNRMYPNEPQTAQFRFNLACVVTAVEIAQERGVPEIAFGYTWYQSGFFEQSPQAITRLEKLLRRRGLKLRLPVRSLASKDAAIRELDAVGLLTMALEQKLEKRSDVLNTEDGPDELQREVQDWLISLEQAFDNSGSSRAVVKEHLQLDGVGQWHPVNP